MNRIAITMTLIITVGTVKKEKKSGLDNKFLNNFRRKDDIPSS